jgi:hypothetical protein
VMPEGFIQTGSRRHTFFAAVDINSKDEILLSSLELCIPFPCFGERLRRPTT